MANKTEKNQRAESKPISLYPSHISFAKSREAKLGIGLSSYVQMLIEYDKVNNVVAKVMAQQAERAAA